jgi:hypothetical protein
VQKCRSFGYALAARAMLRAGEGRHEEAWHDLLACHRLSRLVARGSTLIEKLVGIAVDSMASEATLAFLENAKLDSKQVMRCLQDLQQLPPMPPPADSVDLLERFTYLDCVMLLDRHGPQYLEGLAGGPLGKVKNDKGKQLPDDINWDAALRFANKFYDRMVAAMRLKDHAARAKKLQALEGEIKELKGTVSNAADMAKAFVGPNATPETRGKLLGDILLCLLVPANSRIQQAADRQEQTERNLDVAFALAAYQRDQGSYPDKLEALAPKYLATVPQDLFTGKPLVYQPSPKGYLLYSFGVNGKDDQGRGYEDDPPGDDLHVRMPLPPLPAKKQAP